MRAEVEAASAWAAVLPELVGGGCGEEVGGLVLPREGDISGETCSFD